MQRSTSPSSYVSWGRPEPSGRELASHTSSCPPPWKPLCHFLGVEAPDKPFPHLNDTFRKMVRRRLAFTLAAPVVALSLAGLIL